ncbi:MAG TPA: sugar ABC transporter ATP-binding protein [Spirochaetales bacterium]|nr:sugar ABC transporter ATP-binding protein [Spirochaetales bacterium]HRY54868.1 sugar ABC transporter ATP-binding protein [Spirochaetia bacterium]HRZ63600.1 sugar ABC transporter ATP-binding protein [Spirochaetia bacterium]
MPNDTASGYVLEMLGISKSFPGVQALNDVTLKVRPGTVHALMGENGAGKSTLMKCLFGIYREDSGDIVLKGAKVKFHSAKDALVSGVSMIHQELLNVPDRSVRENVWLGREPMRSFGPLRFLDHRKMHEDTAALMKSLDMEIDPADRMGGLSISKQQACEIAKAVSYDASVVVMDEPSSSLTETETEHLFRIIRDLRSRGVAVIYISHKMSEIFQIADEVSVMRDGRMVGTYAASELDEDGLIRLMVGRDTTDRFPPVASVPGEVRLEVRGLTAANPRSFRDVSFDLRRGEILGIGGLVGAQRTELVEALFGLREVASGEILVDGGLVRVRSPRDAISHGLGLITEDRRGSGIFPLLSVTVNTSVASLGRYLGKARLLEHRRIESEAAKLNEALRTKTPSMGTQIQNLSGGNQQKVLVSRWLMTLPDILIMDEPTRGIDVGAKYEIYTIMAELARNGKSIIMVSSEMPELLGMSHRIMVLCAGRHTGTLEGKQATQENIMRLATQFV